MSQIMCESLTLVRKTGIHNSHFPHSKHLDTVDSSTICVYLLGSGTVSQPAQQQSANVQGCSPATTDPSDPPPKDSSLCPQLSPQVSPHSELSDAASDCPPEKDCRLTDGSDTCCDAQKSPTAAEDEVVKAEDVKEAKNNKKHSLHCPTCKVTVNSSSQLEAHCSGR